MRMTIELRRHLHKAIDEGNKASERIIEVAMELEYLLNLAK